jgi:hypothetical protein
VGIGCNFLDPRTKLQSIGEEDNRHGGTTYNAEQMIHLSGKGAVQFQVVWGLNEIGAILFCGEEGVGAAFRDPWVLLCAIY